MGTHAYLGVQLRTGGARDAAHHVALAEAARRTGADFVVWADAVVPPGSADQSTLDTAAIAARVASSVPGVGLVPTLTVGPNSSGDIARTLAAVDLGSQGRAGWQVDVARAGDETRVFGRKPAAPPAMLWREAADAIEEAVRRWDSSEGEAKAHPLIVLTDDPDARLLAAVWADVVRVAAPDFVSARAARERIRADVAAAGRDPDAVAVLLDVCLAEADSGSAGLRVRGGPGALVEVTVEAVLEGAADGVTLLGLPDADAFADLTLRLAERGLRRQVAEGASLRERFGLAPRPATIWPGERAAS